MSVNLPSALPVIVALHHALSQRNSGEPHSHFVAEAQHPGIMFQSAGRTHDPGCHASSLSELSKTALSETNNLEAARMISSGPVEDRLAIRELVESYNDAVMRFDADAWGANWAEDGIWSLPGGAEIAGKSTIVTTWKGAMSGFSFVGFYASAGPIVVDGNSAHGSWYQQEFLHGKDGTKRNITGQYEDDYVKQGGRWFFKKRVYKVLNAE